MIEMLDMTRKIFNFWVFFFPSKDGSLEVGLSTIPCLPVKGSKDNQVDNTKSCRCFCQCQIQPPTGICRHGRRQLVNDSVMAVENSTENLGAAAPRETKPQVSSGTGFHWEIRPLAKSLKRIVITTRHLMGESTCPTHSEGKKSMEKTVCQNVKNRESWTAKSKMWTD